MIKITRYQFHYYSLNCHEGSEGQFVEEMDKHHLINAFKLMLKIEEHQNNTEWLQHNLKALEGEIIRRLNK